MLKFVFGLFIIMCVFLAGSHLISHFWSGSSAVAFNTPVGPINWLLIIVVGLCVGTWKMLK